MSSINLSQGLTESIAWPLLVSIGKLKRLRKIALRMALMLESGPIFSLTARRIMAKYYGVEIGAYSYGECFVPGAFPAGTSVGRYSSLGPGVRIYLRNHPMDRLSTHPFFYNQVLGLVGKDNISSGMIRIEHDAWIGAQVLITPGCSRIGMGAVVGAGSVVTKDVPDFAIVAGNPARVIRMRFSHETCEIIRASKWWERPLAECERSVAHMTVPLGDPPLSHPFLKLQNSHEPESTCCTAS